MSDNNNASAHDEEHTGPIKNPKQLLLAVFFSFVIPIFVIIGLVYSVTSENKPAAGAVNLERAIAERIQKVGSVEIRDGNRAMKTGEQVYAAQCSGCHATGAAGAPKFGDAAAWGPRIKNSLESLVASALKGKNAMPAQGGGDYSDLEIARAAVHMANAAGGAFTAPSAPTTVEAAK
jgi:cytochrome c5